MWRDGAIAFASYDPVERVFNYHHVRTVGEVGMLASKGYFHYTKSEAEEKEIKQIGVSACGAVSILNTLVSACLSNSIWLT